MVIDARLRDYPRAFGLLFVTVVVKKPLILIRGFENESLATARCPLCGKEHPIYTAKNDVKFVNCDQWNQKVFFNEGPGSDYLGSKGRRGSKDDEEEIELE